MSSLHDRFGSWAAVWPRGDLLIGERANLLAVNGEGTDKLASLEHRHKEEGPNTALLDGENGPGIALRFLDERQRQAEVAESSGNARKVAAKTAA